MMEGFGPPVDQLLRIDDDLWEHKEFHDYVAMGIGPEHVPDLIRMLLDPGLNDANPELAESWAPIHAWRALGTLRAEQAIPALIGIMDAQDDLDFNDWVTEEFPKILGMIGPAAVPALSALLEREDAGTYGREDAGLALVEIVRRHHQERPGIVATLARVLDRAEGNAPGFNGWIVSDLIDLEAKEAAEVIERAYAGEFVDDSICGTWYDVWHGLKLEGQPPPRTDPLYSFGPNPPLREPIEPPHTFANPSGWQPIEQKTPDERKDRNKARQELEKKVKKKGGKGR